MAELLQLFSAAISPDAATRKHAEERLQVAERTEGVLSSTLALVASDSDEAVPARMSAAVFLKNAIARGWTAAIPLADKDFIRANVLEALAQSRRSLKPILFAILLTIVPADYPHAWPDLVQRSVSLLEHRSVAAVEAGLLAVQAVMRKYRWTRTPDRTAVDHAILASFPALLFVGQRALAGELSSLHPTPANAAEAEARSGHVLYLVLKVYKMSITTELSQHQQETIVPWGQLFLQTVQRRMSTVAGVPDDVDDRKRYSWWRAKKWAYHNLNRLMNRYGRPSMLTKQLESYRPFASRFVSAFAPEILKAYLREVELYMSREEWMSDRIVCHVLNFLEESVKPKETWTLLRPHLDVLMDRFVFPFICITSEEVEEFDDEPADYVRSHFAEYIDGWLAAPSTAATGFVLGLASGRKKAAFMTLLNFINNVCSQYPAKRSAVEKDGALRMLAHLSSVICETKSVRKDIETFFITHVFPEFRSEHAFLRCRAFEVLQKFEDHSGEDWGDPKSIETVFRATMQGVVDPALPVRVQAALVLPNLVPYERIRDQLALDIRQVIQVLLKLSNEVDLDNLTNVTRILVSHFSDELLPFAHDLMQSLQLSYMRILNDIAEARRAESTETEEDGDEKLLAAVNILKTMQQILLGLENNGESLKQVEGAALAAVGVTLREEHTDLFEEAFDLLDTLQFALKAVTNEQWSLFEVICQLIRGIGVDYLSEMFPVIDNYLTYGAGAFSSNAALLRPILETFRIAMTSPELGCADRVVGMKIADCAMYAVRGTLDEGVPLFIEQAMGVVERGITTEEPVVTRSLLMHSIETVLNAIHYRADLALRVLDERGWLIPFFTSWFNHLAHLNRAHDKKLAILAICSVLRAAASGPTEGVVVQSSGQLLVGALQLFDGFPAALQRRIETENEYGPEPSDDGDDSSTENGDPEEPEDEDADLGETYVVADGDDEEDPTVTSSSVLSNDDVESQWSEDVLWETPFDLVDVYKQFHETVQGLEKVAPQVLTVMTARISETQRQSLQSIFQVAATGGEAMVKEQARLRVASKADKERPL